MATRGGKRSGTPGKSYSNRTDLMAGYAPTTAEHNPATGGLSGVPASPPMAPPVDAGQVPGIPPVSPDQVLPLDAPTQRPGEPVTAGMNLGPGPGAPPDPNHADLMAMRAYLPFLAEAVRDPSTPPSVVNFVNYLTSQVQ